MRGNAERSIGLAELSVSFCRIPCNRFFRSRIEELRLIEAELSDEEVGIKVGIPQNYNFSRWFKVVTDMTPFQYRRSQLKG